MVRVIPIYRRTVAPQPPAAPTPTTTPFTTFYRCDFCPYRTQLLTSMTDHLSLHKTRTFRDLFSCDIQIGDTYQCPSCEIRSPLKFLLMEHFKLRHLELDITPPYPKIFCCQVPWCGFKTNSQLLLFEHTFKSQCLNGMKKPKICQVNMSQIRQPFVRQSESKDPLSVGITAMKVKARTKTVRAQISGFRPILPKIRRPQPFKVVVLPLRSTIYQCERCLYSVINNPIPIKEHLMLQHLEGQKNSVKYQYNLCYINCKLIMMMDVQGLPSYGKNVEFFQCNCLYRTRIWSEMEIHAYEMGHKKFCEVISQ